MSSSGFNGSIHPSKNDIHIICRYDGDVVLCKTIDNSIAKLKYTDDLYDYLANDSDFSGRNLFADSFELDENYLARIIANYSKEFNNGYIDWRFPYRDLSFAKMSGLVNYLPIAIVAKVHPDGMGGIGAYSAGRALKGIAGWFISNFDKVIDFVKKMCSLISIKNYTYDFFKENYGYDEKFIRKVVCDKPSWKKGFIDSYCYSNKLIYEKKIMRDCGYVYNKKKKEWQLSA